MKILVTGAAGFIGFHLCNRLLKDKKNIVLGIDNYNNYYSRKIKRKRISLIEKNKNFIFKKVDLTNRKKLSIEIKKFHPEVVYHLAGQPGVLYSFKNPKSYKINNVTATKTLCDICSKYSIKNFIYGSSSSVYGDQKKFPIKENFKLKPKNFYALTKYECEKIVINFFKKSITNYKIYRFFTVYGPFGRPDMFIHKSLNSILKKKTINIHNYGKNYRDFTYVEDVVKILSKHYMIKSKQVIFNIARSQPIQTLKLLSIIEKIFNKKIANVNYIGNVKGEMLKTHGCNKQLIKSIRLFKFTSINTGLSKTISIFKKFKM